MSDDERDLPENFIIYPAEQVGPFGGDGVVVMGDNPEVGPMSWPVDEHEDVVDPERFDRNHGMWISRELMVDEVVDEYLTDAPETDETLPADTDEADSSDEPQEVTV